MKESKWKLQVVLNIQLLLLLLVLASAVACERNKRAQAEKPQAVVGSPEFAAEPNIAPPPGVSHVASIAPGGTAGPDGKALFAANCSACHQLTGQGIPGAFPPLDGSAYVLSDNVERMASIMLYGLKGPITVKGQSFNSVMAPLGGNLDNEQLAAIASYVRGAWSNKAGEVAPSVFEAMRAKWGARGQFEIQELGEES